MRLPKWSPFAAPLPPAEHDITQLMQRGDERAEFETYAAAGRERIRRVRWLAKSSVPGAHALAARLSACARDDRCLSPTCPLCVGRTRIWFYGEIARVLDLQRRAGWADIRLVTLVHQDWIIPTTEIMRFNPKLLVDRVRHQFLRAETTGAIVIGAVHGEFDQQRQCWQPHLHLIAQGLSEKSVNLIRHRHYRRSTNIYRPMLVQPLENPAKQISYLFKSYWPMRIRYIDAFGNDQSTFQRVTEPYQTAYLLMLNRFELLDFVLLIGVRRRGHSLNKLGT
jgi:hypothetical protein